MKIKEKYVHTRNYACRIREYICNGIRMASMENEKIKAVFAVDKGTDLVEFVYKPADLDYMWHSFNELKNITHISTKPSSGGNFLDSYGGGWQDLFPTYGGPAVLHGGEIGIHGEICLYPWECQVVEDTPESICLKFSVRTIRTPFLVEKYARLREGSARLELSWRITNLSEEPQEFMWGQHPAFGWPFVDEHTRLYLDGEPQVLVPESMIVQNCPFDKETKGKWPTLPDKTGNPFDMSKAYAHEDNIYMEYAVTDLAKGEYELINEEKKLGIRMNWDPALFPHLWIWGMYCGNKDYPWYGRAYTMAVEPWSSLPGEFEAASQEKDTLWLKGKESLETEMSAELFEAEGGEA